MSDRKPLEISEQRCDGCGQRLRAGARAYAHVDMPWALCEACASGHGASADRPYANWRPAVVVPRSAAHEGGGRPPMPVKRRPIRPLHWCQRCRRRQPDADRGLCVRCAEVLVYRTVLMPGVGRVLA